MKKTLLITLLALMALSCHGQRFLKTFNSVAEMVAANPYDIYTNVMVLGRDTPTDGGGGIFSVVSGDTSTTNLGTVFKANYTLPVVGKWKRQWTGNVNVKWFGAKGDSTTDDTKAVQDALNFQSTNAYWNTVFFPAGKYRITNTNLNVGTNYIGGVLRTNIHNCLVVSNSVGIMGDQGRSTLAFESVDGSGALDWVGGIHVTNTAFSARDMVFDFSNYGATQVGYCVEINGLNTNSPCVINFNNCDFNGGYYSLHLSSFIKGAQINNNRFYKNMAAVAQGGGGILSFNCNQFDGVTISGNNFINKCGVYSLVDVQLNEDNFPIRWTPFNAHLNRNVLVTGNNMDDWPGGAYSGGAHWAGPVDGLQINNNFIQYPYTGIHTEWLDADDSAGRTTNTLTALISGNNIVHSTLHGIDVQCSSNTLAGTYEATNAVVLNLKSVSVLNNSVKMNAANGFAFDTFGIAVQGCNAKVQGNKVTTTSAYGDGAHSIGLYIAYMTGDVQGNYVSTTAYGCVFNTWNDLQTTFAGNTFSKCFYGKSYSDGKNSGRYASSVWRNNEWIEVIRYFKNTYPDTQYYFSGETMAGIRNLSGWLQDATTNYYLGNIRSAYKIIDAYGGGGYETLFGESGREQSVFEGSLILKNASPPGLYTNTFQVATNTGNILLQMTNDTINVDFTVSNQMSVVNGWTDFLMPGVMADVYNTNTAAYLYGRPVPIIAVDKSVSPPTITFQYPIAGVPGDTNYYLRFPAAGFLETGFGHRYGFSSLTSFTMTNGEVTAIPITVTYARVGDFATPSFNPAITNALLLGATVTANDTVLVTIQNVSGVDVPAVTRVLSVKVIKAVP